MRWAIVGSGTRNARAISSVVRPPSSRSVSATRASVDSTGWQAMNTSRSRSSPTSSSSAASRVRRRRSPAALSSSRPSSSCLRSSSLRAPEVVDGAVLRRRHQPGAGVSRHARRGPLLERRDQRVLRQLLGQADVAHHARQAGDELSPTRSARPRRWRGESPALSRPRITPSSIARGNVEADCQNFRPPGSVWSSMRMTHVLRGLVRVPFFTGLVIVTLALGIAANTAIFSVIRGGAAEAAAVSDPEQLVIARPPAAGREHRARRLGAVPVLHVPGRRPKASRTSGCGRRHLQRDRARGT